MFLVASRSLQSNSCMVFPDPSPIEVVNQIIDCTQWWKLSIAMEIVAGALFVLLISVEVYNYIRRDEIARFNSLYDRDTSYFDRLSNLDKKRWLAEEVYSRSELGVQITDDYTFERLKEVNENTF